MPTTQREKSGTDVLTTDVTGRINIPVDWRRVMGLNDPANDTPIVFDAVFDGEGVIKLTMMKKV